MKKEALRANVKALRKQLTKEEVNDKSAKVFSALFSSGILDNAKTVMVYLSAFNEVRTDRIIHHLTDSGKKICAPVTDIHTGYITPYYFTEFAELVPGAMNIPEPPTTNEAKKEDIHAVIIPGIAFDKKGGRMGFGGGYYDKFLEGFDGIKIGICYDFQLFDEIPKDTHDISMDYIISEDKLYAF